MTRINTPLGDQCSLRHEAEAQIGSVSKKPPNLSADELLHELQVYQIELEMQNEALKQSKAALEEASERWISFYEYSPIAYLTLSRDGLITEVNLTGAKLLGEERSKLVSRHFSTYLLPKDRDHWHRFFSNLLLQDSIQSCEVELKGHEGSQSFVQIDSLRLADKNNTNEVRIVLTDIAARKKLESEIRESELRRVILEQREIVSASLDGFWIVNADTGRIVEVNDRYCDIVGYSREEIMDMTINDLDVVETRDDTRARLKRIREVGFDRFETRHRHKQGYIVDFEVSITSSRSGEQKNFAFFRDITKRKRLEKEVSERSAELESLQKLHIAAQTASAIAHEINQPLLAIASYSKAAFMMMKDKNPDFAEISNAIEKCGKQALRAGQSIRDLISFLNRRDFSKEAFDLNMEVIDIVGVVKSEQKLQFRSILNLAEGLPFVLANRMHVQKALLNLIHNGIESMQADGIPLPLISLSISTAKDSGFAQITIEDNGPGIRKEDHDKLFEPFYTTKADGIGMGLAISRSLIEENGGQLWIDPKEGPGAMFHLTLPFAI